MSTVEAHSGRRFNLLRAPRARFYQSSRPALFVFEPLSPSDRRDNEERDNAESEEEQKGQLHRRLPRVWRVHLKQQNKNK